MLECKAILIRFTYEKRLSYTASPIDGNKLRFVRFQQQMEIVTFLFPTNQHIHLLLK